MQKTDRYAYRPDGNFYIQVQCPGCEMLFDVHALANCANGANRYCRSCEQLRRVADEIFVSGGKFTPYFTDAGITHGDIETYPEDWDAMVASLGPGTRTGVGARQTSGHSKNAAGLYVDAPTSGPTSLAERMDAERRNLERLGRQVAFWLGTTLIVVLSCAAGWWLGWR